MTTTENQAERDKLAGAIDPRQMNYPDHQIEIPCLRADLIAASDALRTARPTDAHKAVAEKIFAGMMDHWFGLPDGESVKADVLVERIAAILADLPGGLVLTESEQRRVDEAAARDGAMGDGSSAGLAALDRRRLLAIITRATTPDRRKSTQQRRNDDAPPPPDYTGPLNRRQGAAPLDRRASRPADQHSDWAVRLAQAINEAWGREAAGGSAVGVAELLSLISQHALGAELPGGSGWRGIGTTLSIVNEQAEDEGLWFRPIYASEALLQQALRRLHAAVEGKSPEECALAAVAKP